MKKVLSFILMITLIISLTGCSKKQEPFSSVPNELAATAAYVYNINSDKVVYEKEMGKLLRPGSLVQIMTAMVVMDNTTNIDTPVKSTQYSFKGIAGKQLPSVDIHEGETYTVRELLIAMLVGNNYDAANILAESFGGEEGGEFDTFIGMMNQKAATIGMTSTKFSNPHGFYDDSQSTTAYDMFLMAKYFISSYPALYEMVNTSSFNIPAKSGQNEIPIRNDNLLTTVGLNSEFYDDRARNIKYASYKGHDEQMEHLITYVEDAHGMQYIIVIMRSPYLNMPAVDTYIRNPNEDTGGLTGSSIPESSQEVSADTSSSQASSSNTSSSEQSTSSVSSSEASSDTSASSSSSSSEASSKPKLNIQEKNPYVFIDTQEIIRWVFDTYRIAQVNESDVLTTVNLIGFEKQKINVGLSKKSREFLPTGEDIAKVQFLCKVYPTLDKEVKKGDVVGVATVLGITGADDAPIEDINLIALENSEDSHLGKALINFILIILGVILVTFIIMIIIRMRNIAIYKKKKAEKRRRMRAQMNANGGNGPRRM